MLEAKEVNFAYLRGQPVLNDIDIKIESGEFVALLGHNGSGKTTLSRLFMALIHPRSGQVLVDGTDIAAMEPADLADKIGTRICRFWRTRFLTKWHTARVPKN